MRIMGGRVYLLSFFVVIGAAACSGASKKGAGASKSTSTVPPVADFFRNSPRTSFQISPDAKFISFLGPVKGRMNIFVQARDLSSEPVQLTEIADRDVSGYFWKNPNTILFSRDFNGDENYQLFSVDLNSKKIAALTPFPKVRADFIDDLRDIDPDHVLIGLNKRNPEVFDAYRLDVKTGELNLIAENPGNVAGWMTDHKGALRLAITSDGVNHSILVRPDEKSKFKALLTTDFKENVSPLFFTFDNENVYASSNRGRDKSALVTLDLRSGKEKVVFEDPDVDVGDLSYSKKRKVLWTAIYEKDRTERHFFDKQIESLFDDLRRKIPDQEVGIAGYDENERFFLVRSYSDRNRGSFWVYDSKDSKLALLAEVSPWLHADAMSEMKPVQYRSRDGLTIHGYLTIPRSTNGRNLPLVVNPHGGPWVRDSWGFNSEVQFLASRGYAVFQPNYRGSTGYGRKFWEASFKQWGRKMQDDITDGVEWLKSSGIADPNKIAIYGGSYGGYATLAGLTFTPNLYACGVDYVGVSNLLTFMKTIPPYWKPFLAEMHEEVGDPATDLEMLKAESPVFHVDQIKAPLFVAQGAKDPRVNINESNQIVDALKKRGVAVEYMIKENEGHGFHNEENRFDFYRAMETFLAKYLH